jgi:hypothetical protein
LRLAVQIRAMHPILFEEALHTYFAVSDITAIAISGFARNTYIDMTEAADCGASLHHRKSRRPVERGAEPLGGKGGRHGRSRRPCLARYGLRRGREIVLRLTLNVRAISASVSPSTSRRRIASRI